MLGRVVVVDNASSDSSLAVLPARQDTIVMRNKENIGFAAACNQGSKGTRADYLLFINPDVYLLDDALCRLVRFLSRPSNYNVGICAPRLVAQGGATQRTCARFPTARDFWVNMLGLNRIAPSVFRLPLMKEWDHTHDRAVDQVMGACLLIRRNVFEQLNGFDERFFVYFEEVDLCLRCKQLGPEVYFLSEARAVHSGGGCSSQVPGKRQFFSLQSRILYGLKHFSPASAWVLAATTLLVEPFSRLALAIARRSIKEFRSTLEGYWMLWSSVPSLIQTARKGAYTSVGSGAPLNPTADDDFSAGLYRIQ